MGLHKDAVNALAAAGFVGVDPESDRYADFVAIRIAGDRQQSVLPDDPYVQEIVEYSRRPEVIDEAVDLIGSFGSAIAKRKYGHEISFDMEPTKRDLKRTFGRGGS